MAQDLAVADGTGVNRPAGFEKSYDIGDHSPCIGVCMLDNETGVCTGCARTGMEVAEWPGADAHRKADIWAKLPERAPGLGIEMRLMPWSSRGILEWAADTFNSRRDGVWYVGLGTSASAIATSRGEAVQIAKGDNRLTVRRGDNQFELVAHEKLRAFAFGSVDAPEFVVLTLPKGRVSIAPYAEPGFVESGAQPEPVVYDLGVGHAGTRAVLEISNSETAAQFDGITRKELATLLERDLADTRLASESTCARVSQPFNPWQRGLAGERPIDDQIAELDLPNWAAIMAVFRPGR